MLTRIMKLIEAFFANNESWTFVDYALVAAFVWTILSFAFVFYESTRRIAVYLNIRRQLIDGKKDRQNYESESS